LDFVILEAEEIVNIWQRAEVEATRVSAALLEAGRDSTKLAIPGFTFLVAALESITSVEIVECQNRAILLSVNQLADTVAKQLVAGNVDFVTSLSLLNQNL
jgi:hypothetical protein